MKHPGEATLALFAGKDLGPWPAGGPQRHLDQCERCRARSGGVFRALRQEVGDLAELPGIILESAGGGDEGQYPSSGWPRANACGTAVRSASPFFRNAGRRVACASVAVLLLAGLWLERPAPVAQSQRNSRRDLAPGHRQRNGNARRRSGFVLKNGSAERRDLLGRSPGIHRSSFRGPDNRLRDDQYRLCPVNGAAASSRVCAAALLALHAQETPLDQSSVKINLPPDSPLALIRANMGESRAARPRQRGRARSAHVAHPAQHQRRHDPRRDPAGAGAGSDARRQRIGDAACDLNVEPGQVFHDGGRDAAAASRPEPRAAPWWRWTWMACSSRS